MLTLVELDHCGVYHLTDKTVSHGYLSEYERLFSPFRNKAINIFEVGYWYGGSCELWKRYFPKAHIRSIDIRKPKSRVRQVDGTYLMSHFVEPLDRVRLDLIDIRDLSPMYFQDFPPDIAIDDGSHMLPDQIHFVRLVYPLLREGGVMIVEDIQDIASDKRMFDKLGIPYEIVDNRTRTGQPDSVFLIFRK